MSFAFDALHAPAAIYIEEDIQPAPTFLRFFALSYDLLANTTRVSDVAGKVSVRCFKPPVFERATLHPPKEARTQQIIVKF